MRDVTFIIGNWKIYETSNKGAKRLIKNLYIPRKSNAVIAVAPTTPLLHAVKTFINRRNIQLVSQNVSKYVEGAHTDEISVDTLEDLGVSFCIVGHSEVRERGETDSDINEKVKLLLDRGISPIICIGEKERDENGEYLKEIKRQINEAIDGVDSNESLIIAYEPIWAISKDGKGHAISEGDLYSTIAYIKKIVSKKIKDNFVIYGGSVNMDNARKLFSCDVVDGFLIGSASTNIDEINTIIEDVC